MKHIYIILLLGLGISSIYAYSWHQSSTNSITLCNETTGLTAIVKQPSGTVYVYSSALTKDVLSCIGKALPFYVRSINFIGGFKFDRKVINERYTIESVTDIPTTQEFNIAFDKPVVDAHVNEVTKYKVHIVSPSSPFIFLNEDYKEGDIVYMPEKSVEFETLALKALTHKGATLNVVRRGNILRVRL